MLHEARELLVVLPREVRVDPLVQLTGEAAAMFRSAIEQADLEYLVELPERPLVVDGARYANPFAIPGVPPP